MRKIIIIIFSVILLLTTVSAVAEINADEYFSYVESETWSSFEDKDNLVSMPYGLPESYCPQEVFEAAYNSLTEITEIATLFPNEAPELNKGVNKGSSFSLVGGYQVLLFRDGDRFLSSDGKSLLDIANIGSIWCFVLYVDAHPTGIVQISRSPTTHQYYFRSLDDSGGETIANSLFKFAAETNHFELKSPVFITFLGSSNCIVVADTSDGEKALVSFEEDPQVRDVTYVIGFEQERIRQERALQEDSSLDSGSLLTYKDFVPTPVQNRHALQDYLVAAVGLIFIVAVCVIYALRRRRTDLQ